MLASARTLALALMLGAPGSAVAQHKVALTFDDVPATSPGGCSVARIDDVTAGLLSTLRRYEAPAMAFVVESRACGEDAHETLVRVLNQWLDAGHALGNHSASHFDLNSVSLATYLADVERGAAVPDSLLRARGERLRYFRPPYLHMGPTAAKRAGLESYLREHGLQVGAVTMDNQEWVYNRAYLDARTRGDSVLAGRVVSAYVKHMREVFAYYEQLSDELLGRQIPQVLLLHANVINGDHLDRILDELVARGYEFITMDEAVRDPAYQMADGYTGPRGLSWLQRWALAAGHTPGDEPREATWVSEVGSSSAIAPAAARSCEQQDPAWSPSGDRIAFYSNRTGDFEIYTMRPDGSDLKRLTHDPASDGGPDWSPDGAELVFTSNRSGVGTLYFVDADGGEPRLVSPDIGRAGAPRWSRDGRTIVYEGRIDGNRDIFAYDVHTGAIRRLTDDPGNDFRPVVAPDGRRVWFQSNRTGSYQIHSMPVGGGAATQMELGPDNRVSPDWSADGERVVFMSDAGGNSDIYVWTKGEDAPVRLTTDPAVDRAARWAPDGRRLVFVSDRSGSPGIWLMNADGTGARLLIDGCASPAAEG